MLSADLKLGSHEGREEMGAVLWSILALIFILLSLPNASREEHAETYDEHLFAAYGRDRRSECGNTTGGGWAGGLGGWNCDECNDSGSSSDLKQMLESEFIARIDAYIQSVFQQFTGPLLVHTDDEVILYWKGGSDKPILECISANLYRSFKILSHLPVEAAAIALGNRSNINDTIQDLRTRLNQSRNIYNFTEAQKEILRMINESLNDSSDILELLKRPDFKEHLLQNAKDAVKDYLKHLNKTIAMLNVSTDVLNTTIVIYHKQFAYPESFIVRYYKLLFNYNVRIVLQPTLGEDEYCSSDGNCSTLDISNVLAASTVTFERQINTTFGSLNKRENASIHDFLDAQTEQIVCKDLKFGFESCPKPDRSLKGFHTRTEKAYVVLFVFFAACSVMLGIVLLTVCYEDRVMKAEGKASSGGYKLLNDRDRPLSGVSMESN